MLADALTSLLAIGALLAAKFYGQTWLDPMMGVVGAILVARWSMGLLKASGYEGFCLAEIGGSPEPERIMKYYRAVWDALTAD